MKRTLVIYGGGTVSHVRNHLALCAPAYGGTARKLATLAAEIMPNLDIDLKLTKMAGGCFLETNEDVDADVSKVIADYNTKMVIMSAAICDFNGLIVPNKGSDWTDPNKRGKYAERLGSGIRYDMDLVAAQKIVNKIRSERKDIFLVAFKTTCGKTEDEQYQAGLNLCKKASANLVLANDTKTRLNMVITPEEARYHVTTDRDEALRGLMEMAFLRSQMAFTRSTVVEGERIDWNSEEIPQSLRTVVNYCISKDAYKPFREVTAGHFAYKVDENTFLTSIRKTNFNDLEKVGLVKCVTNGPDTVLAYGAKPSVGGQSQRIVFRDHPGMDCIVHFHSPIREGSEVPVRSQREYECGSHQCGANTSEGLKQFGNLKAVYLDQHGPNIVFNKNINPQEVIDFIEANFDLSEKTGGKVS